MLREVEVVRQPRDRDLRDHQPETTGQQVGRKLLLALAALPPEEGTQPRREPEGWSTEVGNPRVRHNIRRAGRVCNTIREMDLTEIRQEGVPRDLGAPSPTAHPNEVVDIEKEPEACQ